MLSLAWLTVFIIFVYVPGLTLNAIESSSTQLLSGSGSAAQSETSAALVAPSLVRGDDFANEKQFLRTNKPAEANANNITTTPATKTSAQLTTLVSGNAHSVTKDPSPSPSPLPSSSSSSLSSSLLKIQLTQVTASTSTEATVATTLRTTAAASTTSATRRTTTARTWGILNDIEGRNNNGRRSGTDYGQLPSSQKQIQHQQHYQHQQHEPQLALSATQYTFAMHPTPFPLQLTETIQNTARVITRGNGLNWVYPGLASSESPPSVIQARAEVATRPPLPAIPPSTSSTSFMLPLSGASLSESVSPATTLSSAPTSSSTLPFLSTSANTSSTTTPSRTIPFTTTLSPSLSSLDGYLNITSQAGTHAYLPCNVKQLVKKPISWLRVRDGHILTVDQTTFIADQRFQSIYTPNPERWSLQIKYVQTKDAGTYECQVSTEPKTSAIVSLNIVEPKTELIGESNRHVKAGSQVKLRCIISQALEPPLFINWYHNRKQIYLHNRKGWRTEIERDAAGNVTTDKQITIASLIIPSVSKKDSGNYTCSPSNSEPITVVLHVLNGEYSASAITSGSRRTSNSSRGICQMLLHTLLWVISFLMHFGQLRHHHSRLLPHDITIN